MDTINHSAIDNTSNGENIQDNSKINIDDYTRVTQVLYPFSGLDKVDPKILEKAANRGTRVHDICESIARNLGEWGNDEETKGYVDSFKIWWSQGVKVLAIEERFFCNDLMITGKVDMIIEVNGEAIILDLKTSAKPSKTWALQGSAYAYMARKNGYDIKGIQFLHLHKFGAEPRTYDYDDSFDLFSKCLHVYRYFNMEKHAKR